MTNAPRPAPQPPNDTATLFLTSNPAGPALRDELVRLGHPVLSGEASWGTACADALGAAAHANLVYWAPFPEPDPEDPLDKPSAALGRALGPLLDACREFSRAIARSGRPANIVTIVDFSAKTGFAGHARHAALAAGIVGFSKCLALELSRHRIRVNTVCTGPIEGWTSQHVLGEAMRTYLQFLSLGQPVRLDSLARTVSHLLRDDHALTGSVIQLDNGCLV